ncbi:MAG: twin-arginine translocation signal domain-containing protein [Saprospiraceae bacterium]|nr:twin-arginine translocation signal domain-containing protein [Saprospiraceae bacterium]
MSNKSKNSTSCNQADHKMWSRRDFLQTLGITGGVGLAMGGFSVNALAAPLLNPPDGNERILVLIRLKGGNDGLNTIIPVYDFDQKASDLLFTYHWLTLGVCPLSWLCPKQPAPLPNFGTRVP